MDAYRATFPDAGVATSNVAPSQRAGDRGAASRRARHAHGSPCGSRGVEVSDAAFRRRPWRARVAVVCADSSRRRSPTVACCSSAPAYTICRRIIPTRSVRRSPDGWRALKRPPPCGARREDAVSALAPSRRTRKSRGRRVANRGAAHQRWPMTAQPPRKQPGDRERTSLRRSPLRYRPRATSPRRSR